MNEVNWKLEKYANGHYVLHGEDGHPITDAIYNEKAAVLMEQAPALLRKLQEAKRNLLEQHYSEGSALIQGINSTINKALGK